MSDTSQVALAVLCYLVAVLAQLGGIALLVTEARRVGRILGGRRAADPQVPGRQADAGDVVEHLLGNRFDRVAGVALLVTGVVAGALGNVLALSFSV